MSVPWDAVAIVLVCAFPIVFVVVWKVSNDRYVRRCRGYR